MNLPKRGCSIVLAKYSNIAFVCKGRQRKKIRSLHTKYLLNGADFEAFKLVIGEIRSKIGFLCGKNALLSD